MKKLSVSMTKPEIILGWVYLILQLTVLPVVLVMLNGLFGNPLGNAQINFVFFCLNFICITVIFWRFLGLNTKIALASPFRCLQSTFFGFGLYWVLSFVLGFVILMIDPNFSNVNDNSVGALVQENSQLMAIGTVLLVPVVEEVLYRGLIFRNLYNRSPIAAYCVSIAAFAALHIVGYIGMYDPMRLFLCFLQYLPAGFCLGWAYTRADTIWAPILMHITINQIGILSMG